MRALVLTGLLAACDDAAPALPTCGNSIVEEIEVCDDGNVTRGDGCDPNCLREQNTVVSWAFHPTVDGPDQPGCRPGVAEVEIVTSNALTVYRFPCDDNRSATIFTSDLPLVLTRLRDANNDIVAESVPQRAAGKPLFTPFYEDGGFLRLLADECTYSIELVATPAVGTPTTQRFLCLAKAVETLYSKPLRAGTYQIALTGGLVGMHTVEIGTNNRVTELTP